MPLPETTRKELDRLMNEIATLLKPDMRLTLIARWPGKPDVEFVVTQDTYEGVTETIQRRMPPASAS